MTIFGVTATALPLRCRTGGAINSTGKEDCGSSSQSSAASAMR